MKETGGYEADRSAGRELFECMNSIGKSMQREVELMYEVKISLAFLKELRGTNGNAYIERELTERMTEMNRNLYVCFID